MYTKKNGNRKKYPKIALLLTDGSQTKTSGSKDPAMLAELIRKKGIKLIVIGIGVRTKKAELDRVGAGNAHIVKGFKELLSKTFVKKIMKAACVKICKKGYKLTKDKKTCKLST